VYKRQLIYTEALPKAMMATLLVAPPPPPPPPPPPAAAPVVHVKPQVHLIDAGKLVAPKVIPKDIKIIKEDAEPDMGSTGPGVPGGVAGGSIGGVLGGVMGGIGAAPPPPKVQQSRIRQGGNVQAAKLMNKVQPSYPPVSYTHLDVYKRQAPDCAPHAGSCRWSSRIPTLR